MKVDTCNKSEVEDMHCHPHLLSTCLDADLRCVGFWLAAGRRSYVQEAPARVERNIPGFFTGILCGFRAWAFARELI